jgi:hypothetical protein
VNKAQLIDGVKELTALCEEYKLAGKSRECEITQRILMHFVSLI